MDSLIATLKKSLRIGGIISRACLLIIIGILSCLRFFILKELKRLLEVARLQEIDETE